MRVLVFGTFDHLHPGHLYVLKEASKRGDLFVVVARNASVGHIKGYMPDQNEETRRQAVEDVMPDAHVTLGDTEDYLVPVQELQPDLILLGYDQKLPPGVTEEDLPCPVERLQAFEPDKYKSSYQRKNQDPRTKIQ